MKFRDLPDTARFWDVDGMAVAQPAPREPCFAFSEGKGLDVEGRLFPNHAKATLHGDALTRAQFETWLTTGKNKFDI